MSWTRATPVTVTPVPMPSEVAYIAGTGEPPPDCTSSRWREYPALLAFAMFWPVVSMPWRCAYRALSAPESPEKVLNSARLVDELALRHGRYSLATSPVRLRRPRYRQHGFA